MRRAESLSLLRFFALILFLAVSGWLQASTDFLIPPGADANPPGVAKGPDGNEWITEPGRNAIARITPAGAISEYIVPGAQHLNRIVAAPDGMLWFTDDGASFLGSISPATGAIATYTANFTYNYGGYTYSYYAYPNDITVGPDGALWLTFDYYAGIVGRFDLKTHAFSQVNVPATSCPTRIVTGSDKNLWYVDRCTVPTVVRLTTTGAATSVQLAATGNPASDITPGSDGNLWIPTYNGVI